MKAEDEEVACNFTMTDRNTLSNPQTFFERPLKSSKKVGYVSLEKKDHTTWLAEQFASVDGNRAEFTPEVVCLKNLSHIEVNGHDRFQAEDDHGTIYLGRRSTNYCVTGDSGANKYKTLVCFSPRRNPVYMGAPNRSIYMADSEDEMRGTSIEIHSNEVIAREQNKKRRKPQLGKPVKIAKKLLAERNEDMHVDIKEQIQYCINSHKTSAFDKQYVLEKLHAIARSLSPMHTAPHERNNLGIAPAWVNTEMLIIETIAKWVATNMPQVKIHLHSMFTMLFDSDLIRHVETNLELVYGGRKIAVNLDIDPFNKQPLFRQTSDFAGVIETIVHELQQTPALRDDFVYTIPKP